MNEIKNSAASSNGGIRNNNQIPDFEDTMYGCLSFKSRIGGRKENQDSCGYFQTKHGLLLVVCDGMGGANGGKFASQLATDTIIQEVENCELTDKAKILVHAISKANEIVYKTSRARADLVGMGTTVIALLIDEEKATSAHVGDSRIYQFRGKRKVFRTFDHSKVFELVKLGTITEEQARLSAMSNEILRAVGTKPEIDIEINPDLPYLNGDRFLLCSDGICGAVAEKELIQLINSSKDIKKTSETLVQTIDQKGINNGGKHDNLTAALIQMKINSKIKPKMDKKTKIIIGIVLLLLACSLIVNGILFKNSIKEAVLNETKQEEANTKITKLKETHITILSDIEPIKKDIESVPVKIDTAQIKDLLQKWTGLLNDSTYN